METFPWKYNSPKPNLQEIEHINGPKTIEEVAIATQPLQHTQKTSFRVTFINNTRKSLSTQKGHLNYSSKDTDEILLNSLAFPWYFEEMDKGMHCGKGKAHNSLT